MGASVWNKIAEFFHSGYGIAASIVGFALAVYYGPRKMFETWDWYLNRFFDEPVMDILREQAFLAKSERVRPVEGLSVGELAKKLNRTQRSIGRSIIRLKRKNLIELHRGGFRLKE